jgi:hypothetical protein
MENVKRKSIQKNIKIKNTKSELECTSFRFLWNNRDTPTGSSAIFATFSKEDGWWIIWTTFANCQKVDMGVIIFVRSPWIIISNFPIHDVHRARYKLIDTTDDMKFKQATLLQT